ncbi:RagB/SusD family nutrient uptake outer membrane protein [Maribacter sp. MMG018]|uniref:RagB/SusD family nutrient uptake outer membrane protein n=1 Tax=Maribacter sp. MMG018 TaxID=2822688 RepID=UPI001B36C75F|nr:RagB/SusD family nutrient uptake outer membrane protein [Maribacter sp. MMG018]MBQ4915984.1 RagB/SusD family nutrient uptake outer membrane protein [Maribacter sp. MMG018]
MKNIIAFVLLLGLCSSCEEDFLETAPYSFSSPENFYSNDAEIELAITAGYSVINDASVMGNGNYDTFGRGLLFMLNGGTDESITKEGFGNTDYAPWGLASFNSTNKFLKYNWFYWYAGINRLNLLLENLDGAEMEDETRRETVRAEARFLRGLYHMYLAKMFGAIPTYTESLADPEKARQPLNEVYELIIEDFKYAYENLDHRSSKTGRANKWTAGGFLAELYCYLGSCKKFGVGNDLAFPLNSFDWVDEDDMYAKALVVASDVVDNSGYRLIDQYDYLFRATTSSYQREECLFMAEGSDDISNQRINIWVNNLLPQGNRDLVGGGYGWLRPTGEIYYKYTDGDFRRDHNLVGVIPNNADYEEIDGIRYFIPNSISQLPNPTEFNSYTQGKFRIQDPKQKTVVNYGTEGSFPLLRFANVLLLKAEAQYFTGNELEARNTISIVRNRALEDGYTLSSLNSAYYNSDFVEELLDERSRELAFECQRRFDLMRFNKFDEAINGLDVSNGRWNSVVAELKSNWSSHKIWFPLPLEQTEINQNLEQNPGY